MGFGLTALLIIGLCIVTAGLAMSQAFRHFDRSYLLTVSGTRARLVGARGLIWLVAIVVSVVAWTVLSALLPGTVALAIFFAFEGIILDIIGQRIQYIRIDCAPTIDHSVNHPSSIGSTCYNPDTSPNSHHASVPPTS